VRATIYHGPGDVRVEDVPDAAIREPTDAVVRVTRAGICGSDLWFFRGQSLIYKPGYRVGHEFLGVVEDIGSAVRAFRKGDLVVAPDAYSDGTCEFCLDGLHSSCLHGGVWAREGDGGQGEAVRVPQADGTLVRLPDAIVEDDARLRSALLLTDVMATGHHAAVCAQVEPGSTVVVVGDGAVGLCAVLAARRLGAERVIAVGHHERRLAVAEDFGATDLVDSAEPDAAERVLELTRGGAPSVLEAVGTNESFNFAAAVARPGGAIGWVGVPHFEKPDWIGIYKKNLRIAGGMAPARAYLPELLRDVETGELDGSAVLDMTVDLDTISDGYRAMDERRAIKVFVEIS
jgi:alcohol dehydrogenase